VKRVNVGVIGVGNCASSLLQGLEFYAPAQSGSAAQPSSEAETIGLTNPVCAGYSVADVRITSAFDVDTAKIGLDLSAAILCPPNNALCFAHVRPKDVPVHEGILSDGVGTSMSGEFLARGQATIEDIHKHLQATDTDVVVNFLPAGSQQASQLYAEAALRAGCGFINCIPTTIARSSEWSSRYEQAGLPLVGDDLKSQFGATLIHQALMEVLANNGVQLRHTYQIVSGGNMDFLNLQDAERVQSKKASKVQGFGGMDLPEGSVHFGAEYVPFLKDRKIAFIRVEGEAFGNTPLEVEVRMSVEDSPSAAGNVLDAVRYTKFAMDQGLAGTIDPISALLMKATLHPMTATDASSALHAMTQI
jgi:myo-inositol-1-phosphate synthase